MDWINKHRGIVVVVVLIIFCWPVIVNWLYNVETDCKVLHKPQEWTIFWGSYIGSIISAAVAFIILFLQRKDNKEENEKNRAENKAENKENRMLQLRILEQQQEMQWLNMFRQACVEYTTAFSYNNVFLVINTAKTNPNEAFFLIKPLIEKINRASLMIKCIGIRGEQNNLKMKLERFEMKYGEILDDVKYFVSFLRVNKSIPTLNVFYEGIKDENDLSAKTKQIIVESLEKDEVTEISDNSSFLSIVIERSEDLKVFESGFKSLFLDYIKEQEKRIEQITTEI